MAFLGFGARKETLPSTNGAERIYAIGDIHGCFDLLQDLLKRIDDHSEQLPPPSDLHVVMLGDMIDRGPDSRAVLNFLFTLQQSYDRLIVLQGNHEELMLKALDGSPEMFRAWMRIGGAATLRSFGVEPPPRGSDYSDCAAQAASVIPRDWIEWIRRLPLTARSGDYVFCHAGIRPGTSLKRQTRTDLLWIRDEFLEDPHDHGAIIVHGHSISESVEMRHNRIGVDTGAYKTGVLTALYLEGNRREIISTEGGSAVVVGA